MNLSPVLEMSEVLSFSSAKNVARVERAITSGRGGRVYFQATYWPARLYQSDSQRTVLPGDMVTIMGRQGLTLLVKPGDAKS